MERPLTNSRLISLFVLTAGCVALILVAACSRHATSTPAQSASPPPTAQPQNAAAVAAQDATAPAPPESVQGPPPAQGAPVSLDPLEQLVAPIALYPDPLIALVLPASTVPSDLAAAAQYLGGNGDPSQVDNQPWDPSVRGLAHYPTVLEWMAQNPAWTQALGAAFASRPADVMAAIQQLRSMAKTAGTLTNTSQQEVVDEDGAIAIEPAQPEMIYVPSYDPDVVFVGGPYYGYGGPYMTFGMGFPVGFWLGYGFDWGHRAFWHGDWRNWHNEGGWGHPVFPGQRGYIDAAGAGRWRAPADAPSARFSPSEHTAFARPGPMPGAPHPPEVGRRAPATPSPEPRAAPSPSMHFETPSTPAPRVDDRPEFREPPPTERPEDRAPYSAPHFAPAPDHSRPAPAEKRESPPRKEERDRDRGPR